MGSAFLVYLEAKPFKDMIIHQNLRRKTAKIAIETISGGIKDTWVLDKE